MSFRSDNTSRVRNRVARALTCFALAAVALLPATRASAQTNTGAIRGYVRGTDGQPVPDAQVTAVDSSTSLTRNAMTNAQGFYSLNALRPANYTVSARRIGFQPFTKNIQVSVGQVLSSDFSLTAGAQQLAAVTVTGQSPAIETRSSEAATNVSQQQINQLPTPSRNILDLAQLAPGVQVTPDRVDASSKTFSAGALPAAQVNIFVDGASLKNDITASGVAGQDASRGNPFPRNAVQEFRVITNNYKAEYQKASSAIITAVTKSGGNTWTGDAFIDYQNKDLTTIDTFTSITKGANADFRKPDYSRYLFGGSAGGPIIKDKLFFFGSYEGNFQQRLGSVRLDGTPGDYPAAIGGFDANPHQAPFKENLGFAKLTYNMSDNQLLEFSGSLRKENDTRDFGGQSAGANQTFSAADDQRNNVYYGTLKHTYYGSAWTNEAMAGYTYYQYNQNPLNFNDVGLQYDGIGRFGGGSSFQNLTQKTFSLRDDFTYTGFNWAGSHVLKFGVNDDIDRYNFDKELNGNPVFFYRSDNDYATPYQAQYGTGNGVIPQHNNAFGVYAQDDWSPTTRLTFNVGVRWDVETGMFNQDYVTPQAVRDSLTDPTYSSHFFIPIDPNRYFSDGTNRKVFLGAFQPRFGVSYALDEAAKTTVFASAGIFYDRQNSNSTLDESYRRQFQTYTFTFKTGPTDTVSSHIAFDPSVMSRRGLDSLIANGHAPPQQIFLVPNDLKPPKSDQFSVGVRHNFGSFDASVSYNGSRGFNGYTYEWATASYDPIRNDCCVFANLPAYQDVLVGNNDVKTWYNAMYLSINRPYQRSELSKWGWGAGLAYTLGKAEQDGGDLFSFPQINVGGNVRHPTGNDQRHNFVANFITDIPYLWGIQFSGLMTLGSGLPYTLNKFPTVATGPTTTGQEQVFLGYARTPWQKDVDLRFEKDFLQLRGNSVGVTLSVFNLFNTQNLTGFDGTQCRGETAIGSCAVNDNFGHANSVITDGRRIQFGATYSFK
jgi:carboxypeptidase family protein/TonB-dependent receptor-like protein